MIDERLDRELLAAISAQAPGWQFVLIGPVTKINPGALPKASNLHYLGPKCYGDLPRYIAGWDVAMMPFAMNAATSYISPTKTPEYLAAGKPVVSTPIADVVRTYGEAGLAHIAETPDGFVQGIRDALTEPAARRLERADALLSTQSWDGIWARVSERLRAALIDRHRKSSEVGIPRAPCRACLRNCERMTMFDYLVVGAGFAGAVMAERLAEAGGRKVLVVDKRMHIGGNAYDCYDSAGILIHRYGPHIFHTNSREVYEYPRPIHRMATVPASGEGVRRWPALANPNQSEHGQRPIRVQPHVLPARGVPRIGRGAPHADWYGRRRRRRQSRPRAVQQVLPELHRKQWDLDPSELDPSVTGRVPFRTSRDDRYFTDTYQVMPRDGYSKLFERMLRHPNIKVLLNTDYREIEAVIPYAEMVYTGPIDEFFDFRCGRLPYRSLEFQFETFDRPDLSVRCRCELPERERLHAVHRIQVPHGTGAPSYDGRL